MKYSINAPEWYDMCGECGIMFGAFSPHCPHKIWDLHPQPANLCENGSPGCEHQAHDEYATFIDSDGVERVCPSRRARQALATYRSVMMPPSEPKETILIVVKTAAVPTIKADLRTLVLEGEVHPLTSEMLFDIHHKLER